MDTSELLSRKDWKSLFPLIEQTSSTDVIVALTHHREPTIRANALKQTCPCRVQADVDTFWKRIFEMIDEEDPDEKVRWQLLHTICDGAPSRLESSVVVSLEAMSKDRSKTVAHKARQVLAYYNRTGKWNIM